MKVDLLKYRYLCICSHGFYAPHVLYRIKYSAASYVIMCLVHCMSWMASGTQLYRCKELLSISHLLKHIRVHSMTYGISDRHVSVEHSDESLSISDNECGTFPGSPASFFGLRTVLTRLRTVSENFYAPQLFTHSTLRKGILLK